MNRTEIESWQIMYCRTGQKVLFLFFSFLFLLFFQEVTKVIFSFALATAPCQSKASAKPEISAQEFTQLQQQLQDMKEQVRMVWFSSFFWWWLIASLRFRRYISSGSRPSDKEGRGGHPDPDTRGEVVSKNFFSALRTLVWYKIGGGGGGGGPLPWIRHCI